MNTKQLEARSLDLQSAIYGVALSLDAFLVNGISYGILQRVVFDDFLQKTARNLLRDLETLKEQVEQTSVPRADLAAIRARCQQIIDLVTGLRSFRSLPLPDVRLAVSQIPPLRSECVRLIEDLEAQLHTAKPFYPSRPELSAIAVDEFLSGLDRAFVDEWTASHSADASA